nr:ATP-dependent DNA helicase PIF1-like [Hydra vulgaris]
MEDYIHHSMPPIIAEQAALRQIESIINQNEEDVQVLIEANRVRPFLNDNQRQIADAILSALSEQPNNENKQSRLFFMDGPAGCGKTFTYNYLIAETSSRHIITATAAWTGIAATLLKKGCTIHGLFKLPVPILENSTCNVTPNSINGKFLRQVSLYLLDEASMIPKHALNAIDKLLQDVCNNKFPFGGKVILMGGDFRQILPVVKKGQPADIVEACIKCSQHWQYVQRFSLTENMRVQAEEEEFSQWLLKLGSGTLPLKADGSFRGCIEIPEQCLLGENESLVDKIAAASSVTTAASSVTSSKSWEDFRKYRSQHPGPLSMRAFHRWCLYGDDHPSFRLRDGTPYNTGNRADAGRRRQRGSKVVNNFFTF